jgi:hypothetical protein
MDNRGLNIASPLPTVRQAKSLSERDSEGEGFKPFSFGEGFGMRPAGSILHANYALVKLSVIEY